MVREVANSGIAIGVIYDVFLSFRGPDTRIGFTDILYHSMKKNGIHIFRDDEELRPGEKILEILQAIKNSKIYIPIFSKNYAGSKWCLRELTHMVQCNNQSTGKVILPIFYDVDPSDVRLKTDLFESDLTKHEKELGCDAVKPWKQALTTVAEINGWSLKGQCQGEPLQDIIAAVKHNTTTRTRDLPANLVGIDDCKEHIKKLLICCDTSDVRFIIIHGIGGIGKTVLAKAVFNDVYPLFDACCFLLNIRESSPCCGIVKMQRKLAKNLHGDSIPEYDDFEEGNNRIRGILPCCKRVLVVLDGLDGSDQFMQLVKLCTSCCPGSRIIVTIRNKSPFSEIKEEGLVESISTVSIKYFLYKMKEICFDHALPLSDKHAFEINDAQCDLSREAVANAEGLPVVVEEKNSLLSSPRKGTWESTHEKLKKVPLEKVPQRLISYDELVYLAQQIFLDIACFFVDKKITDAMYMWDTCDLYSSYGIDILQNKSLITVDIHDRVSMQDPLRDCGREIVRQEHFENYGHRSRLWSPEKALDMVLAKKGTDNVQALKLQRLRHNFTREHFANLTNVRFLELDGGNFVGNFKDIFPKLRWLSWRNCPPKLQANNFVLYWLVVLKLSGDFTAEHWSGWVKIMEASNLKVLKLVGSKSLIRTLRFPKLVSLERLILKDFLSLAEIDCSINQLEGLTHLKIKGCSSLKELPQEIGCLTKLRELILIHGFSVHYLPSSIGNLRLLSRLVMEDTGVVELPDTIKGLVNLQHLCLAHCWRLNSLPDAVGELKSLTELDLSGTSIKELPRSLWNLKDLKLLIKKSSIKARQMGDLLRLEDIEDAGPLEED